MPLPDERPRASVANLIGRFEQQNKRQSLTATAPSRSSSVASHNTGDSAKEEIREKREWPPKPASDATPPSSYIAASAFWVKPKTSTSPPINSVVLPSINLSDPPAQADNTPAPAVTDKPVDRQAKEENTAGSNTPKPAATPPRPIPADTQQSAKPAAPSSFRSPTKIAATKSAPKSSLGSNSTPIRPQHTGQSTTSNSSSTRKPAAPKTAPSTPSRPKTPRTSAASITVPKTPSSASRPKTPSSNSARPKTPSTGLFAPTAASLARSRNAPSPAPTPTRKVTLSTAAADRLSKPTAASKARTAAAAAAAPSRGTPATRGTASRGGKPKTAAPATTRVKKTSVASAPVSVVESHEAEVAPDTNGDDASDLDVHAEISEDDAHKLEQHEQSAPESPVEHETLNHEEQELSEAEHVVSDAHETDSPASPSPPSSQLDEFESQDTATPVVEKFPHSVTEEAEHDHELAQKSHLEVMENSHTEVGDDIEDMVNLLELKTRPISIVSIPDEVNEIPDEE